MLAVHWCLSTYLGMDIMALPYPLAIKCGYMAFFGQWIVRGSDMCHFWMKVLRIRYTFSNIWLSVLKKWSEVKVSVVCDSLQPHGLNHPWNSPGQNTGVLRCSLLRVSSQPRHWTQVSCIAEKLYAIWATKCKALESSPNHPLHPSTCL